MSLDTQSSDCNDGAEIWPPPGLGSQCTANRQISPPRRRRRQISYGSPQLSHDRAATAASFSPAQLTAYLADSHTPAPVGRVLQEHLALLPNQASPLRQAWSRSPPTSSEFSSTRLYQNGVFLSDDEDDDSEPQPTLWIRRLVRDPFGVRGTSPGAPVQPLLIEIPPLGTSDNLEEFATSIIAALPRPWEDGGIQPVVPEVPPIRQLRAHFWPILYVPPDVRSTIPPPPGLAYPV